MQTNLHIENGTECVDSSKLSVMLTIVRHEREGDRKDRRSA